MDQKNNQQNPKKHNSARAVHGEKDGKVRREGKTSVSGAEEIYCNETSQSGQSTHSPAHQVRSTKNGLDKEVNKETYTDLPALSNT
jgi:hypothetical protein